MTEQALWYIILGLVGVIIGGTGGSVLVRRAIGDRSPVTPDSTTAAAAATAAATAVAQYLKPLENQLASNTDKVTELTITLHELLGACPEKHKAIEQRLISLERTQTNG